MKQLTIRGFDSGIERELRQLAHKNGVSLNKAALTLLRRGAGLDQGPTKRDVVGNSLDHLIGTWSDQEEREFLAAIEVFEKVDPSLWE